MNTDTCIVVFKDGKPIGVCRCKTLADELKKYLKGVRISSETGLWESEEDLPADLKEPLESSRKLKLRRLREQATVFRKEIDQLDFRGQEEILEILNSGDRDVDDDIPF